MTDPVSRLGEIKARRDALTEKYGNVALPGVEPLITDVGWLLEHIEQLQREVTRLNGNWAALSRERDRLWAQRQACLDLFGICDRQPHLGSRRGYVSVAALREAVGG